MSPTVCRTCLTVLRDNSHTFFTLENGIPGMTTFREKLNCCIPELALDIIPNAVICTTCSATLNLAYDFKTKCLEMETKLQKYLQSLNDNYNGNNIIFSSQRRWPMNLKPGPVHKSQIACLVNSEDLKQEREDYDEETTETNVDANENECKELSVKWDDALLFQHKTTRIDKSKSENKHLNEEIISNRSSKLIENNINNETEAFKSYFSKTLQRLKGKNLNRSLSVYDQAREQFNLLKAVKTLAGQGTEININGLGISCKNQVENLEQLLKNPSTDGEKQKKNLERYDCYYCSRSFDRLSLLKTHTISHTGVKPFTCNICGKGCSHKGELNNHMRTHTGEKPFKCSLCESSFSQISNMKIHMRTHTGEKPYKCDYCEKSFSHKCGVKVHMRTHTGERPYKCEICFKTYTHKKDLDDHMRTHTGEKYRCTICSKEITYKKNLSAHMITHSLKNANRAGMVKKNKKLKY